MTKGKTGRIKAPVFRDKIQVGNDEYEFTCDIDVTDYVLAALRSTSKSVSINGIEVKIKPAPRKDS